MSITVNVNGLSLCHKGSDGTSTATLPDVCKTPPGPVPVPYPNVSYSKDLGKGTTTVSADGGNMVANHGSEFAISTGDEPGTEGGVKSGVYTKESTWITFSFDVKFEGKAACRLTDKMFHNRQNTVNMSGEVQNPAQGADADCQAMWDAVDKETKPIVDEPDHIKRNKMITQKYAEMYKRHPDYEWAGLAGVVSRQAGCHMAEAKARQSQWIGGDDAKTAYNALGEANRNIFGDIYPNHRFYELYGWDGIEKCGDYKGHEIPKKLKDAFRDMKDGKLRDASDKIADYEQRIVVEKAVYSRKDFADVLERNEWWSGPYTGIIGHHFGATRPQVAFSAFCGKGDPLLFEGTINNPDHRVRFYSRLMDNLLRRRDANPSAWSQMFDDIIRWSTGR